jgi:methylthioribose-1-phosphate isomerase
MKNLISLALKVEAGSVYVLDQTQLPHKEVWLRSETPQDMAQIIRDLKVRGAPLIGVAASLQLGKFVEQGASQSEFESALMMLREARPTAVNLMNALDRVLRVSREHGLAVVPLEAEEIFAEDVQLCLRMAEHGACLIQAGERVLTHCNTGGLATAGLGTALGAFVLAHQQGKKIHVYVDETRPLLQGGRLTTWELGRHQIPFTLICDNMAGYLMQMKKVDRVMVGADRIARNGDFANKVGTYSLAVLCKHHGIPFHVVAPQTTVDPQMKSGAGIPIEERDCSEVLREWAPPTCTVWNPAFDVTPAELVTSWVLDNGIFTARDIEERDVLCGQ